MNLNNLTTEIQNKDTMNIDELSTIEMVKVINEEDKKVAIAVERELENISKAIDEISEKFINGGRIIYCGAGTSGRLGALDAIELTPTYSVPKERAFGIIAGGKDAMFEAVEGAEDSKELAISDLESINLTSDDVLIAIAASGRTPYTISAIEYANKISALSISLTCNGNSEMSRIAKISIAPVVGPEVITGSTRMKSGSAQKMVLNMISTGVMVRTGKVFGNLMVNVQPTNLKLVKRAEYIISKATGVSLDKAKEIFKEADLNVPLAITMIKTGVNKEKANEYLNLSNGIVSKAIKINDLV